MDLKQKAKQLKTDTPAVLIALKDKRTPLLAKILAAITIGYALSPIDLIPDFIPVLGYLDDVIILPLMIALTIKCIPLYVWEESRAKAAGYTITDKSKNWYYAIPIVLLWFFFIFLIVRAIIID